MLAQYLQTCHLLLAKNLLTDTGLSALGVAMAAGFECCPECLPKADMTGLFVPTKGTAL